MFYNGFLKDPLMYGIYISTYVYTGQEFDRTVYLT